MLIRALQRCKHENLRCIHGDEVMTTMKGWLGTHISRVRCTDCGNALYDREMLEICTVTGEPHPSDRHKRLK